MGGGSKNLIRFNSWLKIQDLGSVENSAVTKRLSFSMDELCKGYIKTDQVERATMQYLLAIKSGVNKIRVFCKMNFS